ncbi:pyruvate oxidase [Mammaliicoccus stepanovicii]|uniref:Pyruvate oxidase n=1 Tax=Mammaliicoccus stepanovicii TaxID=643214 RepID=A0A239YTE4_9STAP|nr:pyruvate oxidase [Mammaliicoccus stepanovicii]PNZ73513.1 pyruvate oxidase [Mammaliicoccus stepanovicii]GGI42242.1 pyruvate oxidase [Mammaliicoccus stepanovicii]SNV62359.1 pyruvate oxidase [Mammaliicoccus stepanovicii]
MAKIKANNALVQVLKNWQIDHVYGIPGDSIDKVVDALKKEEDDIKFYQVRHEEVGTLAASSYAKLTGKIAVALSIGGPGAIHMLNGMYDAKMDNVPMLVLAGQTDSKLLGTKYFQEVDLPKLFEDVAVYNKQLESAENIHEIVDEAIKTAYAKKGVAVLTIPSDILGEKIEDKIPREQYEFQNAVTYANENDIKKAAELINKSEKPVVLTGVGAKDAKEELLDFIDHIDAPGLITLPAKGIIPDKHPNFMGNLGKIGTKPAFEATKDADLLILVGTNYPYVDYLPDKDIPCIQIDINQTNIGKRFNVDVGLVGDTKNVLDSLTNASNKVTGRKFLKACQENMRIWNKWLDEDRSQNKKPIRPERLMAEIEKISTKNTVFSVDVGTSTVWSTRYLQLSHNHQFITSSWLGTMGCALPGAIASKIANPDKQAIAITGDGGLSMVMQDFVTAVLYKLPIIVIVLNNQELSFIKYEQQAAGELEYGIDLGDIDFAKFADSCGGIGYNVEDVNDLAPTLEKAKNSNQPVIVNVKVDPDAAPLPGKIVWDEARGYAKFEIRTALEENRLEKMPPLKTLIRRFF